METGIAIGFNRIVRDLYITTVEKQGCQQSQHYLKFKGPGVISGSFFMSGRMSIAEKSNADCPALE